MHLAAASQMLAHASLLPIALAIEQRGNHWSPDMLDVRLPTVEQSAALRLEAEPDRAPFFRHYEAISRDHLRFVATAGVHLQRNAHTRGRVDSNHRVDA